jgi:hypothetical protein
MTVLTSSPWVLPFGFLVWGILVVVYLSTVVPRIIDNAPDGASPPRILRGLSGRQERYIALAVGWILLILPIAFLVLRGK